MNSEPISIYQLKKDRQRRKIRKVNHFFYKNAVLYLQKSFDDLLERDQILKSHLEKISDKGFNAVLFGGWVRDRIIELTHSTFVPPKDIDIVANGNGTVLDVIASFGKVNPFGGCGINTSLSHLDIWDLSNTFLIKKNGLKIDFETLPLTADYTFNSIIFKPAQFFSTPSLFENDCIASIQDKVIEFQADQVIFPEIQAVRSIIFASRFDFNFSNTVHEFLIKMIKMQSQRKIILNGIEKFCPKNSTEKAKEIFNNIIFNI